MFCICCHDLDHIYITEVLPVIFLSIYFNSEITSLYIMYFGLPYSIDVVSILSYLINVYLFHDHLIHLAPEKPDWIK